MLTKNRAVAIVVAAAAALGHTHRLEAQLANASAATLGLAGNQTAIARGFAAISVNPAGLAMPGSGFSLALLPIQVRAGIDPITLKDLVDVQGELLTPHRDDWMSRIDAANGQSGQVGGDISQIALTMGSIGIQISSVVSANMRLGAEAVETLLFGNADPANTYVGRDFNLEGSAFDGFATTTGALSIGKSLPSLTGAMALGATLKYTVGHAIASAEVLNGTGQASPLRIEVEMPMVHTNFADSVFDGVGGSGFGLDLGFQMEQGPLHLGAAVQNIVNTFSWDESKLVYRAGTAVLESGNNTEDFDEQPLSAAPAALRESIDGMKFKPTLALGGAYDLPMALTVTADFKQRLGDGLAVGPKFNMGVGAEWRGLRIIHLRAGGAVVTGGMQYGGGASIVLGPLNFTAGAATISGDNTDTALLQFAFSLGNR